jgi:hypothetical protein
LKEDPDEKRPDLKVEACDAELEGAEVRLLELVEVKNLWSKGGLSGARL